MSIMKYLLALIICGFIFACKNSNNNNNNLKYEPKNYVEIKHPEWSKNASIYEVNIRQYTKEGTFKAFENHLPRLKEMGIDILWLMPIHPIGLEKRKGTMGSYYAVKDYYGINPEFGTKEDFKNLIAKIHSLGMHVIIDWVGNHSSWDNTLSKEHPDWYTKDGNGNFQPTPWYDWDDVIDFDYNKPPLRKYMTDALKFWVKDYDIDGYRCDVAGFCPVDFWENARAELDAIKPVFMLAEWESRDLLKKSFDMTYSWTLFDQLKPICQGTKSIDGLVEYMAHDVGAFPKDAYRMTFTDNHDMNSWNGNQITNFKEGLSAAIVFTNVVNGMPLVYSGQEAGLDRSLAFFEKDSITWKEHPNATLFTKLFALKHKNKALWNGTAGGEMERIYNDKMKQIISFAREKEGNKILPIINFSNTATTVKLKSEFHKGTYTEYFSNKPYIIKGEDESTIPAWGYLILIK
jgi:cyclomaltodextrinase / maltogenic alpha-amylase / neopullulanase